MNRNTLNLNDIDMIMELEKGKEINITQLSKKLDLSVKSTWWRIDKLKKLGMIELNKKINLGGSPVFVSLKE